MMLQQLSSLASKVTATMEPGFYCAALFIAVALVALTLDLLVRLLKTLGADGRVCWTLEWTARALVMLDCAMILGVAMGHVVHALKIV